MSGIMALLSLDGRPVTEDVARAQLGAITHRGDREPRVWLGEGIALGHVNLPTTHEAEREFLPTSDPTGRFWITWEGRLDNREALAQKLGLDAAQAREMTDAGYVLAAYARWKDACVEHLLGDWAVVIWDTAARRLFCAKDPLGWRPLFYAQHNGMLVAGSEPLQLFAGSLVPRVVNDEFLLRFLAGAVQEPGSTCYAGVHDLEGGQSLLVQDGSVSLKTWWARPRVTPRRFRTPEEAVDEFVALFREATRARLRSNRKIGVFLSGGLDSSYVAAVAAREGGQITGILGYAPDTRLMDERRYAREVAGHVGITCHEIDISDCWSLSSNWLDDSVFDAPEHPVQGSAHVRLAIAAREAGIGVTLGGEGGDEWMSGYRCGADALLRGRLGAAWQIARATRGARSTAHTLGRYAFVDLAPFPVQDAVAALRGKRRWNDFTTTVQHRPGWVSQRRHQRALAWQRRQGADIYWRLYRRGINESVYWRERHAFAPNRVDHRTPFNDLRIIEFMASTPEWMKQFQGRPKDLLREAEYRVLPSTIPDRLDNGIFNELLYEGACARERSRVSTAVEAVTPFPGIHEGIARDEVAVWLERRHRWVQPAWSLITAGLWLQFLGVQRSVSRDRFELATTLMERR